MLTYAYAGLSPADLRHYQLQPMQAATVSRVWQREPADESDRDFDIQFIKWNG